MINYFKISKFFLYLVPLSIFFVTASTLFPFIVGKYVFFRIIVDLALIFFLLGILFQDKLSVVSRRLSDVFKSPLVIAVSFFAFIFVLAGFLGISPAYSFWSTFERGEGGLQIIHLWLFFLLSVVLFRDKKDWRKLFWVTIIGAILMILYGVLALQGANGFVGGNPNSIGFIKNITSEGFRFSGSIGNAAYVATYLVFILFYCFYLLIDYTAERLFTEKKETKERLREFFSSPKIIFLAVSIIIFIIFFFMAATRGAFVGLTAAILSALAYLGFSIKNWRKWSFIVGVLVVLFIVGGVVLRNSQPMKSVPFLRVFDLDFYTKTFQDRTVIWKIAVDGFKERPILGWGAENFPAVFDKHYNPAHYSVKEGFGAWYDRAHNVYLDRLVENGILGLLSFLAIFAVFYWRLLKSQILGLKSQIFSNALLFALPVAYLVQGLVLFDILPTYINIFLFLAFAAHKFQIQNNK